MAKPSRGKSHPSGSNLEGIVATFGANLKAARLEVGLTQAEVAERAGLLQQYVSLVESGKQNVTLTTAQALADVVHKHVTELLTRVRTKAARR